MQYRSLGRTGVQVSCLCLGTMNFGDDCSEQDSIRMVHQALDDGINFIDTADVYSQGIAEEITGKALQGANRSRAVLATKVYNRMGDGINAWGSHRSHIIEGCHASLKRLGTDYIDLYQVHWPERAVSTHGRQRYSLLQDEPGQIAIEETLAALSEQVTTGKVRAIGVCNETPWGVMRYLFMSDLMNVPRLASIQNSYSLLDRQFEIGLAEVAMREGIGLVGYSPLAAGTLTGKYGDSPAPMAGTRSEGSQGFVLHMLSPARQKAIAAYAELARAHGLEPAHMALAFAAAQPFMASVLMAASSAEQLQGNLGAIGVTLSKEITQAINAIHDSHPNPR